MSWPEALRESLGRGRLGETWFVRAPDGRLLVIKRLRPADGDAERLAAGVHQVAAVLHPALVPIVEVTAEDEGVWVRSELVPGVPLQRLIVIAALTPAQTALIARGLLDGLAALSAAGMAHGDLHANNIHIGPDGEVRLSDGGLLPLLSDGDGADWQALDAAAVGGLLRRVAGDERRRGPAWRAPAPRGLLAAIEAAGGAGGQCTIEAALGWLGRETDAVLPEAARGRTAAELGALVRMVSPPSRGRVAPVAAEPAISPPPARLAIPQLSRRARRWVVVGALVLAAGLSSLWLGWRWLATQHLPAARPLAAAPADPALAQTASPLPPGAVGTPGD